MAVYFVAGAGLTKVGYAEAPERRLRGLRVGSPVPLRLVRILDGNDRDEVRLHRQLAEFHSHGEWFRLTDEQVFADFGLADLAIEPEAPRRGVKRTGIAVPSKPSEAA